MIDILVLIISCELRKMYALCNIDSFGNSTMRLFFNFFANHHCHLNMILKKRERVQWDTPSRRAPHTLDVNKSLHVYSACCHVEFIYNYECHRFCVSLVSFYASSCYAVIMILKFRPNLGFLIGYFYKIVKKRRKKNKLPTKEWNLRERMWKNKSSKCS